MHDSKLYIHDDIGSMMASQLCIHDGILCMHGGMLCMYDGIYMLDAIDMLGMLCTFKFDTIHTP